MWTFLKWLFVLKLSITAVVLIVVGATAFFDEPDDGTPGTDRPSSIRDGAATRPGADAAALRDAFSVETPAFRFVMPDTPVHATEQASPIPGLDLVGTTWTIESDDMVLQVLALDLQAPLDDDMAQGAFDSMLGGMARRVDGTAVSDEVFETEGVSGRRSVIEASGVRIFTENYAHGSWVVSIMAVTTDDTPPASYTDLIATFSFL